MRCSCDLAWVVNQKHTDNFTPILHLNPNQSSLLGYKENRAEKVEFWKVEFWTTNVGLPKKKKQPMFMLNANVSVSGHFLDYIVLTTCSLTDFFSFPPRNETTRGWEGEGGLTCKIGILKWQHGIYHLSIVLFYPLFLFSIYKKL